MIKVEPFEDTFGIGQASVARNRRDVAMEEMAKAGPDAFSTEYMNDLWRETQRRRYFEAFATVQRANAILEQET